MNARYAGLFALGIGLATIGCGSEPDRVDILTSTPPLRADKSASIVEGDVLVLESQPVDGDGDRLEQCVTATSSAPEKVEVRRVQDRCRTFVLSAKSPGTAKISLNAGGDATDLMIEVAPSP